MASVSVGDPWPGAEGSLPYARVLGPGSWVLGPGSWVLGPGAWGLGPGSWVRERVGLFQPTGRDLRGQHLLTGFFPVGAVADVE
ncbi:hypothetical protein E3O19_03830 [Cryobacterium algoritolerans]|uniref:Uncharacterized protein n=1 Tax=Cryobacterium algoritolerans TaxID=1259184 RepID=A0A4R8WXX1_9MICO|nr:hypothetical protein E3O19_03830 [Cryobacterium algoritolerans]